MSDTSRYVDIISSISQDEIREMVRTKTTEEYIEIKDFPAKGLAARLPIIRWEETAHNVFTVVRLSDGYSSSLNNWSLKYTRTWNELPAERKADVYRKLPTFPQVSIFTATSGSRRIEDYFDVFIADYRRSLFEANIEFAVFRARRMGGGVSVRLTSFSGL